MGEQEAALAEIDPGTDAEDIVEAEEQENIEAAGATAPQDTEVSGEEPEGGKPVEVDEKQKALNKLAFEKREQKRRADALEERLKKLEAQEQPQAATSEPVRPRESDFNYDQDQYHAAMAKYEADLIDYRVEQKLAANERLLTQRQEARKKQEMQENFNRQVAESNIAGYAESVSKLPQFDPAVLDAIVQADNGPKVAYYLSQHLDVADQIAISNPVIAAMQIGRISERLANPVKQKQVSAAPDPIEPISQAGAGLKVAKSPLLDGATFE